MARIPTQSEQEHYGLCVFADAFPLHVDWKQLDRCESERACYGELRRAQIAFIERLEATSAVVISPATLSLIVDAAHDFVLAARATPNRAKSGREDFRRRKKQVEDVRKAAADFEAAVRTTHRDALLDRAAGLTEVDNDLRDIFANSFLGNALRQFWPEESALEKLAHAVQHLIDRLDTYLSHYDGRYGLTGSRPRNKPLDRFLLILEDGYTRAGGTPNAKWNDDARKPGSPYGRFLHVIWEALPNDVRPLSAAALVKRAQRAKKARAG